MFTMDAGTLCLQATDQMLYRRPPALFTPLDFGLVGFSYACGLGVKLACPDRTVVSLMGDGGFGMTMSEIGTAVANDINTVCIVMNNGCWGAEKAYQRDFFDGRYIGRRRTESAVRQAGRALRGARGFRVERPSRLTARVVAALGCGKPAIVDVQVDPDALYSFRRDSFKHRDKSRRSRADADVRLHRRGRRLGGVPRSPRASRRAADASRAAARGGRQGSQPLDPHSARRRQAPHERALRVEVRDRAPGRAERPARLLAARKGARRIERAQRHGVRVGRPGAVRRLARRAGCGGWGFVDVQPYFQRLESNPYADRAGPRARRAGAYHRPQGRAIAIRCRTASSPRAVEAGIAETAGLQRRALRRRALPRADRQSRPARGAPRSRTCGRRAAAPISRSRPKASSTRVLFDGTRPSAWSTCRADAMRRAARAARCCSRRRDPVAAAARAFRHRRRRRLRALGIAVVADLPAVGEHMIDHLQVRCTYETTLPITINDVMRSSGVACGGRCSTCSRARACWPERRPPHTRSRELRRMRDSRT